MAKPDECTPLVVVDKQVAKSRVGVATLARLVTFSSSFSEGWDIAIFGVIVVPVTKEFGVTPFQLGLLASLPLIGGVMGCLAMGACMDAVGRKPTIVLTYSVCCLGCIVMSTAPGIITLGIGRAILLMGIKGGVTTVSVYMTELSPAGSRGVLVSMEEIYINVGILAATAAAWVLIGRDLITWRAYVAVGAVPSAIALLLFLCLRIPESPRYQQQRGLEDEAIVTLTDALDGREDEVAQTLALWRQEKEASAAAREETWAEFRDELQHIVAQKGFKIALCCWLARAGSGIAIVATFFTLFLRPEMSMESALWWYMLAAVLKLLALFPSVLWWIESCGRRPLFLISALGCCLALGCATLADVHGVRISGVSLLAVFLVLYYMSFSIGYGPVVWVYCFEILPKERGRAGAMSMVPGDILSFCLLICTPLLFEAHSALPLAISAVTNFFGFLFFFVACPETKGLLLEEAKNSA